jgi:hypothetical protein
MVVVVGGLAGLSILALHLADLDLKHKLASGVAATLSGLAGVVALIPIAIGSRRMGVQGAVFGFIAGMMLRLGVSVAAAAYAVLVMESNRLALWLILWYLVVLVVEVNAVTSYVLRSAIDSTKGRTPTPNPSPGETS